MTKDWQAVRYLHQTQDSAATLVWTALTAWIPEAPNAWLKGRDATQRQQGATKGATAWKRLNLCCNSENL